MQKYLLILLLFAMCRLTVAQDSIGFVYQKSVDINVGFQDTGIKSIYWNGGQLILGYCFNQAGKEGFCLSYLDSAGNPIWDKKYYNPESFTLQGNDIIALNNNSFYITGITYIDTLYEYDAFFAKFKKDGNPELFRYYSDIGTNFPLKFYRASPDSLLILTGLKPNSEELNNNYAVWLSDTLGNFDTLLISELSLKYAYQLHKKGNRYFVGGTRRTTTSDSYHVKVFIDVYDSVFTPITTWNPSVTLNEYFMQLFTWNDKLFLSSNVFDHDTASSYWVYRIKIGHYEDGYYHFSNTFGPYSLNTGWTNLLVIDDNYAVVSNWNYGDESFYFLDTNLTPIAISPYGLSPYVYLYQQTLGINLTPGKRIAGTGGIVDSSFIQAHYIFLTRNVQDYLDMVTGISEYEPDKKADSEIIAFPNPFSNNIKINIPSESEKYNVIIYDLNGRIVLETKGSGFFSINTESLKPGVYILKIFRGSSGRTFKMIKGVVFE